MLRHNCAKRATRHGACFPGVDAGRQLQAILIQQDPHMQDILSRLRRDAAIPPRFQGPVSLALWTCPTGSTRDGEIHSRPGTIASDRHKRREELEARAHMQVVGIARHLVAWLRLMQYKPSFACASLKSGRMRCNSLDSVALDRPRNHAARQCLRRCVRDSHRTPACRRDLYVFHCPGSGVSPMQ